MWSLGMILHMLVFFRLPYDHVDDDDISKLEEEVRDYSGYHGNISYKLCIDTLTDAVDSKLRLR